MKVVAINGSPRKGGNTAQCLEVMAKEFEREGIEFEVLQPGANVKPCMACYHCLNTGSLHCVQTGDMVNEIIDKRIDRHISFISSLSDDKRKKCYINEKHHFPVKTRQEIQLCIRKCRDFDFQDGCILCSYESVPAKAAKKK